MSDTRRKIATGSFLALGILIHAMVCEWTTGPHQQGLRRLVRLPHPRRLMVGSGATHLFLNVDKQIGLPIGIIVGVLIPLVLVTLAGLVQFNKDEFRQIMEAGGCVMLAFVLVLAINWLVTFW